MPNSDACKPCLSRIVFHQSMDLASRPVQTQVSLSGWNYAGPPGEAIAVCKLLWQPVTNSPSPRVMALNPVFATSSGSFFALADFGVEHAGALEEIGSVAPDIRQVTVTPLSLISCRSAKENESRNALL